MHVVRDSSYCFLLKLECTVPFLRFATRLKVDLATVTLYTCVKCSFDIILYVN
jgi:hypothetical protein